MLIGLYKSSWVSNTFMLCFLGINLIGCEQAQILANAGQPTQSMEQLTEEQALEPYSDYLVSIDIPLDEPINPPDTTQPDNPTEPPMVITDPDEQTDYCLVKVTPVNSITPNSTGKGGGKTKVMICHRPPGNPTNDHTLVVGAPAVKAHLAHGDSLGSCDQESPDEPVYTECP